MSGAVSKEFLARWHAYRQKARTDTLWLARDVLGYKDISMDVQGGIVGNLPKFPGGTDGYEPDANRILYSPAKDMWELDGPRRFLTIFMRGGLKTTIATITHAIQWIINYPDVRVLASTATGDQARKLVTEIKGHFQFTPKFRWLFPEFCPEGRKAADFGSQEAFTTPARQRRVLKEPTFSTCSIGKVIAGGHYDVILHSDLVDKENVRSPGQMADVRQHYRYMGPLLERSAIYPHYGWVLVEGTVYDFSDLHQELIDRHSQDPSWSVYVQGCYTSETPEKVSIWPQRYPVAELERIRREDGEYIFASQYLCRPVPLSGKLADYNDVVFTPRSVIGQLLPGLRLHVTIDLHGMESDKASNDFTVLTLGGFDRDGRLYILEISRGHLTPFQVIEAIFDLYRRFPSIVDFKIEKDAHARVLLPFLRREMVKRQRYPIISALSRDSRTSKVHRIMALQPWFRSGIIRFSEDISAKTELIQEITRFPNYAHDDILDTLADQMKNRDGGGELDVVPLQPVPDRYQRREDRFLGFDPLTHEASWTSELMRSGSWHEGTGL